MSDFSDLDALVHDLGAAPQKVIPLVRAVVESTGEQLAEDWTEDAAKLSGTHAKKYAKTIFSRMGLKTDGEITATIQPRRGRQGNLGEVLELGGGGIKSKPQQSGRKALRKNEAEFLKRLADAGEDALNA